MQKIKCKSAKEKTCIYKILWGEVKQRSACIKTAPECKANTNIKNTNKNTNKIQTIQMQNYIKPDDAITKYKWEELEQRTCLSQN